MGRNSFIVAPGPGSAGATSRRLRSDDAAIALKVPGGPLGLGTDWEDVDGFFVDEVAHFYHFSAWKFCED